LTESTWVPVQSFAPAMPQLDSQTLRFCTHLSFTEREKTDEDGCNDVDEHDSQLGYCSIYLVVVHHTPSSQRQSLEFLNGVPSSACLQPNVGDHPLYPSIKGNSRITSYIVDPLLICRLLDRSVVPSKFIGLSTSLLLFDCF
jgi:hypothetical protein